MNLFGWSPASRLSIHDGTLEAIKWIALLLMVLDHVNTFLYARKLPYAYEAGRLVMPLFAFVLAYNLARPQAAESGLRLRTMRRLLLAGLAASPFFMLLIGKPLPLNIMFTLLVATAFIHLLDRADALNAAAAVGAIWVGGMVSEFNWFGVVMCAAAWAYCQRPSVLWFAALAAATASLWVPNGNHWAMAALPVMLLMPHVRLHVPRVRYAFYVLYPAHFAVLWAIQNLTRR